MQSLVSESRLGRFLVLETLGMGTNPLIPPLYPLLSDEKFDPRNYPFLKYIIKKVNQAKISLFLDFLPHLKFLAKRSEVTKT